jgi:hypothetical protein
MAKEENTVDPVMERLDRLEKVSEAKDAEISNLRAELQKVSERKSNESSGHSDIVEDARLSADNVEIVVYGENEAPVVGTKIIRNFDKEGKELNSEIELDVIGENKPVRISYGNLENPNDFMQLKTKVFALHDILDGDLTGASKIQRDVIVEDTGTVPEMKLTGEAYVPTGRQVRQVVRKDIRYYTIEFDGKKYELGEPVKEVQGYKLIRK